MGALYLKDLADKTRRGLEGRVRQGRSGGGLCYGYRVVRGARGGADGEPERGLREIDPAQAAVVRRIFAEFAAGHGAQGDRRGAEPRGRAGPAGRDLERRGDPRPRPARHRHPPQPRSTPGSWSGTSAAGSRTPRRAGAAAGPTTRRRSFSPTLSFSIAAGSAAKDASRTASTRCCRSASAAGPPPSNAMPTVAPRDQVRRAACEVPSGNRSAKASGSGVGVLKRSLVPVADRFSTMQSRTAAPSTTTWARFRTPFRWSCRCSVVSAFPIVARLRRGRHSTIRVDVLAYVRALSAKVRPPAPRGVGTGGCTRLLVAARCDGAP